MRIRHCILLMILCILGRTTFSQENSIDDIYQSSLMHYFEQKDSMIVPITIEYFRKNKVLDPKKKYTLVGFYSELFKEEAIKNKILNGLDEIRIEEVSDFFHWIAEFDNDEFYNKTAPNPSVNDMYWASYFASGNEKYLDRLFYVGKMYFYERKDILLFLSSQSAVWSLASNAEQYTSVKEYLEKKDTSDYIVRYILRTSPENIKEETINIIKKQKELGIWK